MQEHAYNWLHYSFFTVEIRNWNTSSDSNTETVQLAQFCDPSAGADSDSPSTRHVINYTFHHSCFKWKKNFKKL